MSYSNDYLDSRLVVDEEFEGGTPSKTSSVIPTKEAISGKDPDLKNDELPHESDYNCCIQCIIKMFKKMYPSHRKIAHTPQGVSLRNKFKLFTILNMASCVLSLAIIGFYPLLYSALVLALSYSGYLTLREWVVCLHITMCITAVFQSLQTLITVETIGRQFITGCVIGYFVFQAVFISKYYIKFRQFGGIKGKKHKKDKKDKDENQE